MRIVYRYGMYLAYDVTDPAPFYQKGWHLKTHMGAWATSDISVVLPLAAYCEGDAKTKVDALIAKRRAAVAPSIAVDADIEIPAPDGLKYRPYQKAGIAYALQRKHTLIADVMRLGKTIQGIGVINSTPGLKRALIVCPANAKINWVEELTKWCVHPLTIGRCEGPKNPETDILVINYDILKNHIDYLREQEWDVLIGDEIKACKNPRAKRTELLLGNVDRSGPKGGNPVPAKRYVWLDGTPVYSNIVDLWPICRVGDPDDLGRNYWDFVKRYCGAGPHNGWDTSGATNLEELQLKLRTNLMIRREKKDVATEVEPFRQRVVLPKRGLEPIIRRERAAAAEEFGDISRLGIDPAVFERLAAGFSALEEGDDALQQIEASGSLSTIRRELALAKLPMVYTWLEGLLANEEKVVLFCHHRDVVDALHAHYPGSARVYGGMSEVKRHAERLRFQNDPNCKVFVGNITSAGQAISLSAADVVVFVELSWVPSDMDQAEERIWTTEKTYPLSIYHLVVEDSIDYAVSGVLQQRQKNVHASMNVAALNLGH